MRSTVRNGEAFCVAGLGRQGEVAIVRSLAV
jgi:hypothetical protein